MAVGLATGLRWLILPPDSPFPSVTYFPVLLVLSVYAGPVWGFAGLIVATLAIGWPLTLGPGGLLGAEILGLATFIAVAAISIFVAAALRKSVVELRDARAAQEVTQRRLESHSAHLRLAEEAGGLGLWEWDLLTERGVLSLSGEDGPQTTQGFQTGMDRVHPDDREQIRLTVAKAMNGGRFFDHEYRTLIDDGERWIHSHGEVIRDTLGKPVRMIGYNFDITERRHAVDRLRESEARFRMLADSAPAPMWVTQGDRRREFVNRAYTAFLGLPYETALDTDWRGLLHPDDAERIVAESIAGEASGEPFTLEARYRVGEDYRWIRSFSQPRGGPGGSDNGFIGIAFDITDSKRAEADLQRLNDLLAERMRAALSERDQAQASLMQSQKLEAVGQLTGGVAHDFNNLLTVVIGALDILSRHPEDPVRRARLLDAALSAARRGEQLVRQLLAFARRQPLRTDIARIDEVVRQDETLIRRAVGEAVRLAFDLNAGDAACALDVGQFEAALLNLVVNARDATPDGGLIEIATTCFTLDAPREPLGAGRHIRVSVSDTGHGMDEATRARAFEPFFTTKPIGKGTGLGLSQVYGFARQSGGDLEIDSAPGQGARFSIILPCPADPAPAPASSPQPEVAATEPLRILLVEDDRDVAELVDTMLAELGHRVRRAGTVDEALATLEANPDVDLVLSDVIMPGGKSGVDLAQAITGRWPGLPVILSSGYTGDTLALAEASPWPLLRKPYTLQALASAIAEVMAARADTRTS
jgi:PAS domain S-box-containing protein